MAPATWLRGSQPVHTVPGVGASVTVPLDEDAARATLDLVEALEDNDDVQTVTANFEVSDAVMAKLSAA